MVNITSYFFCYLHRWGTFVKWGHLIFFLVSTKYLVEYNYVFFCFCKRNISHVNLLRLALYRALLIALWSYTNYTKALSLEHAFSETLNCNFILTLLLCSWKGDISDSATFIGIFKYNFITLSLHGWCILFSSVYMYTGLYILHVINSIVNETTSR